MSGEFFLYPFSLIYEGVTSTRNNLYEKNIFQKFQPKVLTVGVGNLTVGGTGKTPITMHLIKKLCGKGKRVGVVSRGYKGKFSGIQRVELDGTVYYGDEPTLIAQTFPDVPVYVGRKRKEVIEKLLKESPETELIIADDVFQHRELVPHCNILVLDATEPLKNYRLLPIGRGRESFAGVTRADLIFINKSNLVSEHVLSRLIYKVENEFIKQKKKIVDIVQLEYHLDYFYNLSTPEIKVTKQSHVWPLVKKMKVATLTGLARPKSFETLITQNELQVKKNFTYPDHYHYQLKDVEEIEKKCRMDNIEALMTTEKDAVKLSKFKWEVPVWVSHLKLGAGENYEEVINKNIF